jgi:putative ABC transport system ATP-binding protein
MPLESTAAAKRPVDVARDTVIRLDHIHKTYYMGDIEVHALRGVSLEVERGEYVAIMGPSGSGKSTTMNIVGCLDHPTRGTYRLDGLDVSQASKADLADIRNQKVGFVFQSFNLVSRTSALENVELPMIYAGIRARERSRRAKEALEIVGLSDKLRNLPNQLSGGQQQRVAIARALVTRPTVVFADEPTGNLDSHTSAEILELLRESVSSYGQTTVMVTHDPRAAAIADRILFLADGRIVRQLGRSSAHEVLAAMEEVSAQ